MKILVIFTGGTIGSHIGNDGRISTNAEIKYQLINEYKRRYGKKIDNLRNKLEINKSVNLRESSSVEDKVIFDTEEPYRILSENLKAENLTNLIQAVNDGIEKECYAGIIVTHGTDTLQYSAAILQYVFADISIPVMLVSSDYIITDERANGVENFAGAVEFIRGKYGKGVFVSYKNPGEDVVIHRGNRLQNVISYSSRVESIKDSWYGRFTGNKYVANENYRVKEDNININLINKVNKFNKDRRKIILDDISDYIIRLRAYPGMTYPDLEKNINAEDNEKNENLEKNADYRKYAGKPSKIILYESYHSGTLCIDENLKKFAEKAKQINARIYVIGLNAGGAEYETVQMYRDEGLIPLANRAAIAQYCKFWLAVSNGINEIFQMEDEISICEDFA